MNIGGTSDPYVIVALQPGAAHSVLKTKVVKKNLNPVFDETFITMVKIVHSINMLHFFLKISKDERMLQRQVSFEVFDWERIIKDKKIGKVNIFPEKLY